MLHMLQPAVLCLFILITVGMCDRLPPFRVTQSYRVSNGFLKPLVQFVFPPPPPQTLLLYFPLSLSNGLSQEKRKARLVLCSFRVYFFNLCSLGGNQFTVKKPLLYIVLSGGYAAKLREKL